MEVKETGDLGLAAPNLGSDLRLGHSCCGSLSHSPDEFGARLCDSMVGMAGHLRQVAGHDPIIACAIRVLANP